MAFDYSGLAATAQDLITEFGRTLTLKRADVTPDDGAKPWRGADPANPAAESVSVPGVFTKFSTNEIDNENIHRLDKKLVVAGLDVGAAEIEDFDTVVDGGETYEIKSVLDVQPGPTTLVYFLQVRQ